MLLPEHSVLLGFSAVLIRNVITGKYNTYKPFPCVVIRNNVLMNVSMERKCLAFYCHVICPRVTNRKLFRQEFNSCNTYSGS